jgi:ABC-type Fe3+ transport system substrate-binding protein
MVTPHNQDIRNEFGTAFSEWHKAKYGKGVEVRFSNPGGTGDISRLLKASYAGHEKNANFKAPFDVVWGGGDYFFDTEVGELLEPCDLPQSLLDVVYPEPTLAGVKLYSKGADGKVRWVGVCISAFGIVYNPDVYELIGLPAPETWKDLTRPEMSGWVALANPTSSSSAATAYSMVYQRAMADEEEAFLAAHPGVKMSSGDKKRAMAASEAAYRAANPRATTLPAGQAELFGAYKAQVARGWKRGMGTLVLMAANARYFSDSGTQPPSDVASGDAAAAVAIDFYGRNYEGTVGPNRERMVTPKGATAINPDPAAILLGVKGEKYELANHFLEFLLSKRGQEIWIGRKGTEDGPVERELFRPPARRDMYVPANTEKWTHPDLNPFKDAMGFNMRSEFNSLFTETRMLWAASWIDDRDDLQSAYRKILKVSDPARRDALLAELADIPMTYEQLEGIRGELRKQPKDSYDEFRARLRISMATDFREHYRRVAAKAE